MASKLGKGLFENAHRPFEMRLKEFDKGDQGTDDGYAYAEFMQAVEQDPASKSLSAKGPAAKANWRSAKALIKLRDQLNAAFPNRSKASDGFIGDLAHCPGSSDHCPNINDAGTGVVTAFDATHDPANGCDMKAVVEAIRAAKDKRVKYIIFRSKICNSLPMGGKPAWAWRPYGGANPHNKHAHISVKGQKTFYDGAGKWTIA